MRSALLILVTIVVLVGAFVGYTLIQAPHAPRHAGPTKSASTAPVPPPSSGPSNPSLPVTSGDNAFVENYDKDTGQLASRFRASRYDPQPDGTVHVDHPEAEFYLNSRDRDASGQPVRQILRLRGDQGDVVVPPTAGGTQGMNHPQMPTRGKLHNVNVSLFPTTSAKRPSLTCRVNNLAFDNDTFRIATDSYTDAQGKAVDADRVPVYVQGDDYDFEGRGLTIVWDEKDRHLQLLEVARGQTLTIKKPGAFGTSTLESKSADESATTKTSKPTTVESAAHRPARKPKPGKPAASRPTAESAATSPSAPTTSPSHESVPYRATFNDNVVITQGDRQIAVADVMNVDFLSEGRADEQNPATEPTSNAVESEDPTTRPAKRRAPAPRAAPKPASRPIDAADVPEAVPVIVRWTGKLRVVPTPPESTPPSAGDSVVELVSENRPVLLNWQGSDVVCASVKYHSLDDSASLRSSEAVPLISVKEQRGLAITTPAFDYDGESRVAVMRGNSHADIPMDSQSGPTTAPSTQPAQMAHVEWGDRCTMHLTGASRQEMTIEHALLEGDVKIDSPQLAMRSDKMDLTFDPNAKHAPRPQTRPADDQGMGINPSSVAIRELAAQGTVRALVRDSNPQPGTDAQPQKLDCSTLNIHFEDGVDGRAYPKQLIADGSVVTSRGDSELRAGHLDATLAPATQPSVADAHGGPTSMPAMQIDKMVALDNVRATGTEGQFAQADQLNLEQTADGPKYKLLGEREPARVGDARSVMSGPIIEFEPDAGRARVLGAGTLHAVQVASANNPSTRPVDLTWQNELNADTNAKHAEITGDVVATSKQEDGSTTIARGQKMLLELSDPPTTAPTTAATNGASSKRHRSTTSHAFAGFGMGTSKGPAIGEIRSVTLEDQQNNVEVNSTLANSDGAVLKRMNLFAPSLTYNLPDKRLTVPTAGRMLYQDQRPPPATRPAQTQPTNDSGGLGDARGATAFQWQKSFTYDSVDHLATMTGDVAVVHQAVGSTVPAYRLNAERVIAEMQEPPTTQPEKKPTAAPADNELGAAKLKRLTADGGVTFTSNRLQFSADSIEYDPQKQQLIARGTDRAPATLFDESGLSKGTFSEMYYDTKTDRMRLVKPQASLRK